MYNIEMRRIIKIMPPKDKSKLPWRIAESGIRARRFYIIDRAQIRAREEIRRMEDEEIFNTINRLEQD